MSLSNLTPKIRELCAQCSPAEQRVALAECCDLAYTDRQLRRMEVRFVRTFADELGVKHDLVAEYARKARQGKLKIKLPASQSGRALLFYVALAAAAADGDIDFRERTAIDKLAGQLRLSPEMVDAELSVLVAGGSQSTREAQLLGIDSSAGQPTKAPPEESTTTGFFGKLVIFFTDHLVIEEFEAKLYRVGASPGDRKSGEIEFCRKQSGRIEIEVELKRLPVPTPATLAIFIDDQHFRDVAVPQNRFEQIFVYQPSETSPAVCAATPADVRHEGVVILQGEFRVD